MAEPPLLGHAEAVRAGWPTLRAAAQAAIAPRRALDPPPSFLHSAQVDAWRRTMHALRCWRGALVAERVGFGKTWIGLAVAARWNRAAVLIAPAILIPQWTSAAQRAGVRLDLWSHERLSRGRVPSGDPRLVLVDEAHRLRHLDTRRARTLAPWLPGRATLLLTATPIVNRVDDLLSLLRLILPDDALALDGIAALPSATSGEMSPGALGRVVIRSHPAANGSIRCREVVVTPDDAERGRAERAVAAIDRLTLSHVRPVRRLLRTVLCDAAASSDAAFAMALRRYRALLLAAHDAGGGSRGFLRAMVGRDHDQMVFWDLVPRDDAVELAPEDLPALEASLPYPCHDHWIEALDAHLPLDAPVVCFARHRATARAIAARWGDATAWVVGGEAGIGPHRMARAAILAAFGPARTSWALRRCIPLRLVTTDVAAEGLDLQAAGWVIHADLPWTAMRLHQREGRFLREGQQMPIVRSLIRLPAPAFERRLAPRARVARKAALAERWNESLQAAGAVSDDFPGAAPPLVATFSDDESAAAALVAVTQRDREGACWIVRRGSASWRADPAAGGALLERARFLPDGAPADHAEVRRDLAQATRIAVGLGASAPTEGSQALILRIHRLARAAARNRDAAALRRLDGLLRFAMAPQTHGGRLALRALAEADDAMLARYAPEVAPARDPVIARPVALLLFRSRSGALR